MAQKQSEKKTAETTEAKTETLNQKEALKVATGETGNKKYKLSNPNTSYSERNFTLVGDQEKELPKQPSSQLVDRIRSGFIVEAGK